MMEVEDSQLIAELQQFARSHMANGEKRTAHLLDRAATRLRALAVDKIPVNLPFERVPHHAWDSGHGPVPPIPKECEHRISTKFACPRCNIPRPPPESEGSDK